MKMTYKYYAEKSFGAKVVVIKAKNLEEAIDIYEENMSNTPKSLKIVSEEKGLSLIKTILKDEKNLEKTLKTIKNFEISLFFVEKPLKNTKKEF